MKKMIPFFILVFFLNNIYAQDKLLLQNYKFRTNRYNALNLFFNSAAQHAHSNNSTTIQDASGANLSMSTELISYKSSDKILQSIYSNMFLQGRLSRYLNSPNTEKRRQFGFNPDFKINQQWYTAENSFTELGFGVNSQIASNNLRQTILHPVSEKYRQTIMNLTATIGYGKGRLEHIADMQNALWLQQALQEAGLLKNNVTTTTCIGLAQAITKANNFRILDGRRRTKYLLSTVDSYIAENQLIDKRGIEYFSSLNDVLFFANNFERLSGTEK
jgi:hypothetical protein